MNRLVTVSITSLVLATLLLAACAPTAAPVAPAPASQPPRALASAPTAAAELTPEQVAWNKVVEGARKERKLVLYTYYFYGDVGLAVAKAFREQYGIDIEFIVGRGAEFNERIATEQRTRQYTVDVLDSSPSWINRVKERGFTLGMADLPGLQAKDVWSIYPVVDAPEGHTLAFAPNPIPVAMSTRLVKPEEEPRSWNDLLAPKWKGKIGINDPVTSSGPDIIVSYMTNHRALDMDYFRRLGEQELVFLLGGSKEGVERVARGELAFSIVGSAVIISKFLSEGAPIKPLDLKEGRPIITQTISAIKNAPHPNSSRLFLNWLFSAEGQRAYTSAAVIESVRKDVSSAMPRGWVPASKPIVETVQDINDSAQGFKDQVSTKLFKRK